MTASEVRRPTSFAAPALIVVAALLAYANSFDGVFVFDDLKYVADNPAIRRLGPPFAWATFNPSRPLGFFTFAVNYALHGDRLFGYHAVNLAIHLVAALALYGFVRRTLQLPHVAERYRLRADALAAWVAVLWVVHPLGTQAVTYLYQRFESLASMFAVLALYAFVREYADRERPQRRWAVVSLGCVYAAMLTKESVIALPILVLIYDYLFIAKSVSRVRERRSYHVATFCSWGLLLALNLAFGQDYEKGGIGAVPGLTPVSYLLTQGGVLLHYLYLTFVPLHQSLDYDWPIARSWSEYVPQCLFVVALLATTIVGLIRGRLWSFAGCAFFLLLAPTSSLIPIVDVIFEHRMYLPLAAVLALAVCAAVELLRRFDGRPWSRAAQWGVVGAASIVVVVFTALTHWRNEVYYSRIAMWSDVVSQSPHNARAWECLAQAYLADKNYLAARDAAERSLALNDRRHQAHLALGSALFNFNDRPSAIRHYSAAIQLNPGFSDAYVNLGVAVRPDDPARAAELYQQALALNPQNVEAIANLANIAARNGEFEKAAAFFRVGLAINPHDARLQRGLQLVLEDLQQLRQRGVAGNR